MTTPIFPSVIGHNLLDGGTDAQDGNSYPGPLLQEYAADGGANSWAGDRNGAVFTCLSNAAGLSRVTRAVARDITATRCKRLYLGYQHGGVCGIEDSVAEGNALSATGNANGVTGQSDLYRAITDSAGSPSGMSAVTANLAGVFAAYAK